MASLDENDAAGMRGGWGSKEDYEFFMLEIVAGVEAAALASCRGQRDLPPGNGAHGEKIRRDRQNMAST
jgi:hypothetical protein